MGLPVKAPATVACIVPPVVTLPASIAFTPCAETVVREGVIPLQVPLVMARFSVGSLG